MSGSDRARVSRRTRVTLDAEGLLPRACSLGAVSDGIGDGADRRHLASISVVASVNAIP